MLRDTAQRHSENVSQKVIRTWFRIIPDGLREFLRSY